MIDEHTATRLAAEHAAAHLPELSGRSWRPSRFDGGWRLVAEGHDLRWRTGVTCLVVRDDGSVHEDSASLPPDVLARRHQPPGDGRGPEEGGR